MVLAFDLGGTTIRAGIYDPGADVIIREARTDTRSTVTLPDADADTLLRFLGEDIMDLVARIWPDEPEPVRVAIGLPGPLGPYGEVLSLPTVLGCASTTRIRVPDLIRLSRTDARIVVLNDVTAAGYAVMREPRESFCIVTVSSGIGMKLFTEGKPVVGPQGRGGEIGHTVVAAGNDVNRCDCGGSGHLGSMASGRGVLASARRRIREGSLRDVDAERLNERHIVGAFHDGAPWATDLIGESARYLGHVLACLHTAVGVERFVIVGGFAVALGEPYRELLATAAADNCWDLGQAWHEMFELVDLHDRAGMLGAGRYMVSLEGAVGHDAR
jgi:predicted NBD/HSP70 family sugar kinase